MAPAGRPRSVRWYRSFYFRIGFSFVVFVIGLLVTQSAIFNLVLAGPPFPLRSPNNLVAILAADLSSALSQEPSLDLNAYLRGEYARLQPIYVVMKNGVIAANRAEPLTDGIRESVQAVLTGKDPRREGAEPAFPTPFVMAPIQVGNELRGIVVLPPAAPPGPIARDVGRLLSLPGTGLLVLATILVAAFIFEPSRRRLKALQQASRRLGAGDLAARAPVEGADEITDVSASFNRMAAALAERDEALRVSDRLRRQMLADVSHELRTPLTAMRGYIETLRMTDVPLDQPTRDRYFATIERETLRLDRLVADLLDLARLENGVGELQVRVFAIRRLFEHVVDRHHQELARRRVRAVIDVAAAADQIVADPDRLEQVVDNLFANALRHTENGSIELRAVLEHGACVIAVVDTGTGVDETHLPHVFERFYKADAARANAAGGSGLGLTIAESHRRAARRVDRGGERAGADGFYARAAAGAAARARRLLKQLSPVSSHTNRRGRRDRREFSLCVLGG